MAVKIEIEGDSEGAIALALLQMVARAEGKLDALGEMKGVDRDWILDTYVACLAAAFGDRNGPDDDADEDDDLDEDDGDDGDEGEDDEEDAPADKPAA